MSAETATDAGLSDLVDTLRDRLESIAEALLGQPSSRKPRAWRWGRKGSLCLELYGRKRGRWYNHESGEGGGPLQLIQHAHGYSLTDAIEWARSWIGEPEGELKRSRKARPSRPVEVEDAADQTRRIALARRLWGEGEPVAGTVADRYLSNTRGIAPPASGWPDAVRFHPPSCSLILTSTTADGTVQAVQRVHLTPDGHKAKPAPDQPTKMTNGVLSGAAVRLPGNVDGPLLLAEGPETGLSVWAATGYETMIALGGLSNLRPSAGRVVVCRDDDKPWSPSDKKFRKTIKAWIEAEIGVVAATPWSERRHDRSDFNDTIQAGGGEAVRARIEAALHPTLPGQHRFPVTEARHTLGVAMSDFFALAAAYDPNVKTPPPVHAMRVDVGVGKSLAAREGAATLLSTLRASGDNRTVVFAVPTHKLADEQAAAFIALPVSRSAGLTAAVWRGREAADPEAPGQPMCRNTEAVQDAHAAGVEAQSAVCKGKAADGTIAACPFFDVCGYQRQRLRQADLWIVAHELLFTEKPGAVGDVAVLVVDEASWQDGLEGVGDQPIVLTLDSLRAPDRVPGDPLNTDRLIYLRRLALAQLLHFRGKYLGSTRQ